jgi:hypothetical protein
MNARRSSWDASPALALIALVYLLGQASQLCLTPLGEAMDFYGHLAYVSFYAEEGRAPAPDEASVPAWFQQLQQTLPAPDLSTGGDRYRTWAGLSPADRAVLLKRFRSVPRSEPYETCNYQSQHPPLYYAGLSVLYRRLAPHVGVEALALMLAFVSVLVGLLAFPALYAVLRRVSDERRALLALLALAWYPNLMPFLGRITNDALAFPLLAWGLLFCLRSRETGASRDLLAAAALLTLASFTKTYALTLWPVYIACAARGVGLWRWRQAALASGLCLLGAGALLAFNLATAGHAILLHEMRGTASVPWSERLLWVFKVDPVWFVGGLVKGFWWSGYWSFVSPGVWYYAPLLLLGFLAWPGASHRSGSRGPVLWPHFLALSCFALGMLWHAATFSLLASLQGETTHSGNEGWYANVLIGSVAAILLRRLGDRLPDRSGRRALSATVVFLIAWNLLARLSLILYWSGLVEVQGRLRGVDLGQAGQVLGSLAMWRNWLALPGVTGPVLFTAFLPLVAAVALSGVLLARITGRCPEANP